MCLKKRNEKRCVYMIDWCASDTVSLCLTQEFKVCLSYGVYIWGTCDQKWKGRNLFFCLLKMMLSWRLAECDSSHFEFKVAPECRPSPPGYLWWATETVDAAAKEVEHTPWQIFTPEHIWPIDWVEVTKYGTHTLPEWPSQITFVLLPSMHTRQSCISL